MKRAGQLFLGFVLCVAAPAAAQIGPERPPDRGGFTSVSFTSGARTDSRFTVSPSSVLEPSACTPDATTFCANGNRFQLTVIFSAPSLGITNAPAQAVPLTADAGYFWFFSPNNVELVTKVVDGRAFNGFFWVFGGALTDVAYTITVVDTLTGATKTYSNSAGHLGSFADTAAFPGTNPSCTYTVSPLSQAFDAMGGSGTFVVTTAAGCTWAAASDVTYITITSGASGTGPGSVRYSVAANGTGISRTGTLTIAGQTVTVTQSRTSTEGGAYDGTWSGTTNQTCQPPTGASPCGVNWTISNNNLLRFEIHYAGAACGINDGATVITYNEPGRTVDPASFNVTSNEGTSVRPEINVNITKTTTSAATGSGSLTLTTSSPLPSCTTTVPLSFTATKI